MIKTIITISSLLLGIGIMLSGNGLQGTLLALRGVEEHFSESTIGFIMSMYFIGFIAGTFLCPYIIQRVGHIRTFAGMAAICASITVLFGLWVEPVVWGAMRFIHGICIVGIFMVTESWLNTQSSNQIRGQVFAVYILVNLVFLAAGQFLILAGEIRSMELFAISAALFSFSLVPVALTRVPEPPPISKIRLRLRDLYHTSTLGLVGGLISGLLSSLFWSLGPLFAKLSDFSGFGIALFMSTTILGGIVLQWPIGYWSDQSDRRWIIMLVSCTIVVTALLVTVVPSTSYYLLAVCMFFLGGAMFSIYPLSVAHTNDHPEVTDSVSISTNLLFVYGLGAAAGPAIGGILMHFLGRYSLLGLFILGGGLLGYYAWYRHQRGSRIPDADKSHFTPLIRTSQVAIKLQAGQEEAIKV
ncbi:MAG: MFS transporter [Gammaproteobacteria bacterium]|nr:MFS transporter [Gammaproteobacteria bacterium]